MSKLRDRCLGFLRGLYVGGIGAGLGLAVFFSTYLGIFAAYGPMQCYDLFSPGMGVTPLVVSFVSVTIAGILGRRAVSVWRVIVCSCVSIVAAYLGTPLADIGWRTRRAMLMAHPLAYMDYVWFIFTFNVVAIGVCYASAPGHFDSSRTAPPVENLTR